MKLSLLKMKLKMAGSIEQKKELINKIGLCGPEALPILTPLLDHQELGNSAFLALRHLPFDKSKETLLKALSTQELIPMVFEIWKNHPSNLVLATAIRTLPHLKPSLWEAFQKGMGEIDANWIKHIEVQRALSNFFQGIKALSEKNPGIIKNIVWLILINGDRGQVQGLSSLLKTAHDDLKIAILEGIILYKDDCPPGFINPCLGLVKEGQQKILMAVLRLMLEKPSFNNPDIISEFYTLHDQTRNPLFISFLAKYDSESPDFITLILSILDSNSVVEQVQVIRVCRLFKVGHREVINKITALSSTHTQKAVVDSAKAYLKSRPGQKIS